MPTSTLRPVRLTPPQSAVLAKLAAGWVCATAGQDPPVVRALLWYRLEGEGTHASVQGTTLKALLARALVAWDATTLTLAYDGSAVPGFRLILTPAGRAASAQPGGVL